VPTPADAANVSSPLCPKHALRGSRSASPASPTPPGVDRTFLYRHRDLLAQLHADQAQPTVEAAPSKVSRTSLQADLLAAHERAARLASHIQRLERRLSEALGEQLWRESGLGAPQDVDELQQRITQLEQQAIDLRLQLEERDQDLAAARAANRELMTRLNTMP
jgi:polyhydroxyalkanoate synthesis regulator phasin